MGFIDKHIHAMGSSNLMDDAFHHQVEALQAAACADKVARRIGSLLSRVKYADTTDKARVVDNGNLAQLVAEWLNIVTEKGTARRWVKSEDVTIAHVLYRRVANASLAHYLDPNCKDCGGTGAQSAEECFAICPTCKGSRTAEITGMREYERLLAVEMASELQALEQSFAGAANALLRKEA